ncbi:hypothetical protein GCM10009547_43270 [Sporichthya brevicatena]|uniref:Uncharacterized protein n=1 Tax=Sporichthya brevicatena TaxID=171442 RepID=A0ABN1H9R4_9ACTN
MVILKFLRVQWDRAAAVAAALLGLGFLVAGWIGVSGTPYLPEQMPYLASDGLLGLYFVALAVAMWLSADLRDEWRQLRALNAKVADIEARLADRSAENGHVAAAVNPAYASSAPDGRP